MAVWHHAYAFDAAKYLDDVSRVVTIDSSRSSALLAAQARRVVQTASRETTQVLEYLCFDPSWLADGVERTTERLLIIMLAAQVLPIPSLGGGDTHSWAVLERLAGLPGFDRTELKRLVRGDRLARLPGALRREDLETLFADSRHLGGALLPLEVTSLTLALSRLEHRFHGPNEGEAAAFGGWSYTDTLQALARAKAKAFDDATRMLRSAEGRAVFMLFEQ